MKKIELLAPAGSYDSMRAAIHAGADAIYIGGTQFGARAYANNLEETQLLKAIQYVHLHNKQVYLTVNTLLKNDEIEQKLYSYLEPYYKHGLDAVIVQDIGALQFINQNFPKLPIHASTQMTLMMAEGAQLLEQKGVTRLVAPRELSLREIKTICNNTTLEMESFVHGALCYCYSGQCFMSSLLGGRSGNRGRCAQTCRMPYKIATEKKVKESYLLSTKDICTISILPELIESGICSLKIEGRMKRAEYTALTVCIYRKYIDLYTTLGKTGYYCYLEEKKDELQRDKIALMDLYNRGNFSTGYYKQNNGANIMSLERPNHYGVLVGRIKKVKGNEAAIELIENIGAQDILEIREKQETIYEYTVKSHAARGQIVQAKFKAKLPIREGQEVYRTKNNELLQYISNCYLEKDKKILISGILNAEVGKNISLTIDKEDCSITVFGHFVEQAQKQPITEETIRKQLNKLNDTYFHWNSLKVKMDKDCFIPIAQLNELRREAIKAIEEACCNKYNRTLEKIEPVPFQPDKKRTEKTKWIVSVEQLEQLEVALTYKEIDHIYISLEYFPLEKIQFICNEVKKANKGCYILFPHIVRTKTYNIFVQKKHFFMDILDKIDGFVIKNLESYSFLKNELQIESQGKEIILDYIVYTMNSYAKQFWREKEVVHFTAPIELNKAELQQWNCEDSDLIVYGYLPLMVCAQCIIKNRKGCTNKNEQLILQDRKNKNFIVQCNCNYCYNHIYNGQPLSLLNQKREIGLLNPKGIRIQFTIEQKKEVAHILHCFIQQFSYNTETNLTIKEYTKGHFKRGIE